MSATLPEVLEGFADMLSDLDVQVYNFVPDKPLVPCLVVYPERWTYATTEDMTFIVLCLAETLETQGGQERLMTWLSDDGPDSIIAAIDADSQLGGIVSSVIPLETRNWTTVLSANGTRYHQAELVCNVLR